MLKYFDQKDANNYVAEISELRYKLNEAILEKERLKKEYQEARDNVDSIERRIHDCAMAIYSSANDFKMYGKEQFIEGFDEDEDEYI